MLDAARTLAMVLESAGYEVRTAHDGHEAVQAAQEFEPAAAVLDIGLPGMDGYQLADVLLRSGAPVQACRADGLRSACRPAKGEAGGLRRAFREARRRWRAVQHARWINGALTRG